MDAALIDQLIRELPATAGHDRARVLARLRDATSLDWGDDVESWQLWWETQQEWDNPYVELSAVSAPAPPRPALDTVAPGLAFVDPFELLATEELPAHVELARCLLARAGVSPQVALDPEQRVIAITVQGRTYVTDPIDVDGDERGERVLACLGRILRGNRVPGAFVVFADRGIAYVTAPELAALVRTGWVGAPARRDGGGE